MPDIAAIISDIVGKPVRYESVTPEQKREGQLAAGLPPALVDALYDQAIERLAHPRSRVFLETHEKSVLSRPRSPTSSIATSNYSPSSLAGVHDPPTHVRWGANNHAA